MIDFENKILNWISYVVLLVLIVGVEVGIGVSTGVVKALSEFINKVSEGEISLSQRLVEIEELYVSQKDEIVYELIEGWNFVAFPLKAYNFSDADKLIRDVNRKGGQATTVSKWDGDRWQEYTRRGIKRYGENFEIEPGKAYFIRVHKPSVWRVKGDLISKEELQVIKLNPGWNTLGLFNEDSKASNVIGKINMKDGEVRERATVLDWWTKASNWELYIQRIDEQQNAEEYGENFSIGNDKGYMIFVNEEIEFKEDL